jgi:protein O-mannosyl-transferase
MLNKENVNLRWRRAWVPLLMVLVLGLLVYSNTWKSPFVFDDIHTIVEQEARRTLDFSIERWFGTRTLPVFTLDLNYYMGELNVIGYHAFNIGVHLVSSMAMFWLSYLLSSVVYKTRVVRVGKLEISNHLFFAMVVSMFFVAHPIQTQAITYIVQRLASIAAMFYILALLFYVKFRLSTETTYMKIWGGLSIAASLAAMHSKEIAVTLPVAIVMMELFFFVPINNDRSWWKFKIDWRQAVKRIPYLLPWIITIIVIPAYMLEIKELVFKPELTSENVSQATLKDKVSLRRITNVSAETVEIPRDTYLLTEINVVRKYWQLIIWPAGQNLDHDVRLVTNLRNWPTAASLLLHVSLLLSSLVLFIKGRRMFAYGLCFFYLAILPESSIIPIIDVMFEHRLYLPMLGVALIFGDLGQILLKIKKLRIKDTDWLVVILVSCVLMALAVTAFNRNGVWKDEVTLWTDSTTKSPNKARPYNNLGKAYLDKRMFDKAEELYLREVEIDPDSVSGHNNLGSIYGVLGRYEEALAEINRAIELRPDHDAAFNNLGNIYMLQTEYDQAEQAYQTSIELNSRDAGVWRNLGDVLARQEKYTEAVEAYRQAINLVPGKALWHSKLGAALGAIGNSEEAKTELLIAIKLDAKQFNAYSNLGNVYATEGNFDEAAKAYVTYLQATPTDTGVMNNLAKVFIQKGMNQKALEVFNQVIKIDPENAEAILYIDKIKSLPTE